MEPILVSFTLEEANALLRMLDLAVRQGGMQVAETAVVLSRKVQSSAVSPPPNANGKELNTEVQ